MFDYEDSGQLVVASPVSPDESSRAGPRHLASIAAAGVLVAVAGCASPTQSPLKSERRVVSDDQRRVEEVAGSESSTTNAELLVYMTAIREKVMRNWVRPSTAPDDLDCFVAVEQLPDGKIASTRVVQCNGNETVVRSIEEAITRSSPLPLPADPALFVSSFQFRFTIPDRSAESSGRSEQ